MQRAEFETLRNELAAHISEALKIAGRLMSEVYNTPKEREYDETLRKPLISIRATIIAMRYPKAAIDYRRERIRDDYYKNW